MDYTRLESVDEQTRKNTKDIEELSKIMQDLKQNLQDLKQSSDNRLAFMKDQFAGIFAMLNNKPATATHNSVSEGFDISNLLDSEEEMTKKVVGGQVDSRNEAFKMFDGLTMPIATHLQSTNELQPFLVLDKDEHNEDCEVFAEMPEPFPRDLTDVREESLTKPSFEQTEEKEEHDFLGTALHGCDMLRIVVGQPHLLTMGGVRADHQLFNQMPERFPVEQRSDIHEKCEPFLADLVKEQVLESCNLDFSFNELTLFDPGGGVNSFPHVDKRIVQPPTSQAEDQGTVSFEVAEEGAIQQRIDKVVQPPSLMSRNLKATHHLLDKMIEKLNAAPNNHHLQKFDRILSYMGSLLESSVDILVFLWKEEVDSRWCLKLIESVKCLGMEAIDLRSTSLHTSQYIEASTSGSNQITQSVLQYYDARVGNVSPSMLVTDGMNVISELIDMFCILSKWVIMEQDLLYTMGVWLMKKIAAKGLYAQGIFINFKQYCSYWVKSDSSCFQSLIQASTAGCENTLLIDDNVTFLLNLDGSFYHLRVWKDIFEHMSRAFFEKSIGDYVDFGLGADLNHMEIELDTLFLVTNAKRNVVHAVCIDFDFGPTSNSMADAVAVLGLISGINHRHQMGVGGNEKKMEGALVAFGFKDLHSATKFLSDSSVMTVKQLESINQEVFAVFMVVPIVVAVLYKRGIKDCFFTVADKHFTWNSSLYMCRFLIPVITMEWCEMVKAIVNIDSTILVTIAMEFDVLDEYYLLFINMEHFIWDPGWLSQFYPSLRTRMFLRGWERI